MNWLPFALLSALVYTIVNFVDKYVVEREIPDPLCMPVYASIMATLVSIVLFIATGFPALPLGDTVIILFSGALNIWAAAFYFQALRLEEASKIVVLFQVTPLFVLLLSFTLLRDTITAQQLLGFVLILAAAVALSLNRGAGAIRLSRAFWLMMGTAFLTALSLIVIKYVSGEHDFEAFVAYESLGLGFGGLVLFLVYAPIRRAWLASLRAVRRRAFGLIFVNETMYVTAKLLSFYAVTLGPVALVAVVNTVQVFIAILFGWVLTLIAPLTFREGIERGQLAGKVALALVVFAGVWLIS